MSDDTNPIDAETCYITDKGIIDYLRIQVETLLKRVDALESNDTELRGRIGLLEGKL